MRITEGFLLETIMLKKSQLMLRVTRTNIAKARKRNLRKLVRRMKSYESKRNTN